MGSTVVKYFVVLPDGQRFGPADVLLLNQWVAEGRILPNTVLEQEGTGQRMMASSLPGLSLAPSMPYPPPSSIGNPPPGTFSPGTQAPGTPQQYAGYYRGPAVPPSTGQNDLTMAWVFSSLGLMFCLTGMFCGPCAIVGIVFPILGVVYGNKAVVANAPGAQAAKIFAWTTLALYIVGIVGMFAMFGMLSMS